MSYSEILKKLRALEYELNEIIEVIEEKEEEMQEIEQPEELYNGKVVCIESKSPYVITGKIYEFKNGTAEFENGYSSVDNVRDFIDLTERFGSKFIEVREEEEEEADRELYNGKVICIESSSSAYTKGKIYESKDGVVIDDDSDCVGLYRNFEDFRNRHCSKFIEIIGEEENE